MPCSSSLDVSPSIASIAVALVPSSLTTTGLMSIRMSMSTKSPVLISVPTPDTWSTITDIAR